MRHLASILVVIILAAIAPARRVSAADPELLPDLIMGQLEDLRVTQPAAGQRQLRFSTTIINLGDGPFRLYGSRPNTNAAHMGVIQSIARLGGGERLHPTAAIMYFAGDGHAHWHVRDLESYVLERIDTGEFVGQGAKHGFCFFDYARANVNVAARPAAPAYTTCGRSGHLNVTMGLSVGWADIYYWNLRTQYLDITAVPDGTYRLWAVADPDNWFVEQFDTNNATWVDLNLRGHQVEVLGRSSLLDRGTLCFNPDGVSVCLDGRFKQFWLSNGGLDVFGYPISAVEEATIDQTGRRHFVQHFERARFEYHPDQPYPHDVQLSRLGDEVLKQQGRSWWDFPRNSNADPACIFFEETGHSICDQQPGLGFKSYWLSHGINYPLLDRGSRALMLFGMPLSEPTIETNAAGYTVLTQWFERARFEWYPDNPDKFKVQAGLMGREFKAP